MLRAVIIRTLLVVLALLLVFGVILFFIQDGMIYMPRKYDRKQLKALEAEGLKQISCDTGEGKQVAFYLPPEGNAPDRIWLVFGGNVRNFRNPV